jgi:integrase
MPSKTSYLRRESPSAPYKFLMRVPVEVVERIRGREILLPLPPANEEGPLLVKTTIGTFIKFSVRTRNFETAKARELAARAEIGKVFRAAKKGATEISQRQRVALAGCVYRLFCDAHGENPGTPEKWAAWKAFNRAAGEGRITSATPVTAQRVDETEAARERFGEDLTSGIDSIPPSQSTDGLEARFGAMTNWVLSEHNLEVDAETRKALLKEVFKAAQDAGHRLKRNAGGDFRPDPQEQRFPPFEPASELTLSGLFEKWKAETKPAANTVATWRGVITSLKNFLGHENVRRIRDTDVIRWKDKLVDSGLTGRTINDSYLAALRTVLNFAVRNRLLPDNPAKGVKVSSPRAAAKPRLEYSDTEVARLLQLARQVTPPTKRSKYTPRARRWLPWLEALTGARIGELSQLWGEDIQNQRGIHFIHIHETPDGGRLKNVQSERQVPLHSALVREGFLDFVSECGKGPLFYGKTSNNPEKAHASKGVANRLAKWIREKGFNDERKDPNHAFRHWFKSTAARVKVSDSIANALQGHVDETVASRYRHFSLETLNDAVQAIPVPLFDAVEPNITHPQPVNTPIAE